LPAELKRLFQSELAEQVEQIKIVPETLNTEEISRMWTAFQAHYRPTAAYQASVVLIESKASTKSPLPVRARDIHVEPLRAPVILSIQAEGRGGGDEAIIIAGDNLLLIGTNLSADFVRVTLDGEDLLLSGIEDTRIVALIPATVQAGAHGVQIIHAVPMGSPPVPHRGVASPLATFVLSPRIDSVSAANVQGAGAAPRSADILLTVKPAVGDTQRVLLMLNQLTAAASPPPPSSDSYTFVAPSRIPLSPPSATPAATEQLMIPVSGVTAGTYLVRVLVDGATSPLGTDPDGHYVSPQVTIP
jgi:hypothetical protein